MKNGGRRQKLHAARVSTDDRDTGIVRSVGSRRQGTRSMKAFKAISGFNFPKAGYDLIDPLDLPVRECEPLDTANAISLSGRVEHPALAQENGDGLALGDHALDFGPLASQEGEVLPGRFDNLVTPPPASIHGTKSADVEFNIVGHRLSECVEVALDDGAVDAVKSGLGIAAFLGRGREHRLE